MNVWSPETNYAFVSSQHESCLLFRFLANRLNLSSCSETVWGSHRRAYKLITTVCLCSLRGFTSSDYRCWPLAGSVITHCGGIKNTSNINPTSSSATERSTCILRDNATPDLTQQLWKYWVVTSGERGLMGHISVHSEWNPDSLKTVDQCRCCQLIGFIP
jgi:hypothetical protein